MTKEKKETKKTEKVDPKDERIAELEQQIVTLNGQLQTVVQLANNHIGLTKQYERTIALLSGRIQELNSE
tara:strand:+ start:1851 stop:2060 length:210 start_codon:yes stop_codon:yes gene_type:complete